jgi:hypothetical protein
MQRLSKSSFRASFRLDRKDRGYIEEKGLALIERHARDFLMKRIAPAEPCNDGRQTPFSGHPVFKAQHATATCCRGCMAKWHNIPKGRALSDDEINQMILLVMEWLRKKMGANG